MGGVGVVGRLWGGSGQGRCEVLGGGGAACGRLRHALPSEGVGALPLQSRIGLDLSEEGRSAHSLRP